LEKTVVAEISLDTRLIYYSGGTLFAKPVFDLGYVIALSLLIELQIAELVAAGCIQESAYLGGDIRFYGDSTSRKSDDR
jgi:hypothetical protein